MAMLTRTTFSAAPSPKISRRYAWLRYSTQWGRTASLPNAVHIAWLQADPFENDENWMRNEEWFSVPREEKGWEVYHCEAECYSISSGINLGGIQGGDLHHMLVTNADSPMTTYRIHSPPVVDNNEHPKFHWMLDKCSVLSTQYGWSFQLRRILRLVRERSR